MGLRTMKRRRRQAKTDYKLRKNLLKSDTPRIVIRVTNRYIILQVVQSSRAQDKVVLTLGSKELLKSGWDVKMSGSLKSIPAGYLTGLLAAKKIKKGKFIVDLGMARTLPGSRVFSVVNGLVDGGLEISAEESIFPSEERLKGTHLKEDASKMVEAIRSKL